MRNVLASAMFAAVFLAAFATVRGAPAQTPPASPAPAAPAASPTSPTSPAAAPGPGGAEPAPGASAAPAAPVREATGYAPSSIRSAVAGSGGAPKAAKKKAATASASTKKRTGSAVIQPGFEAVDGGGTRVFVELGQTVPVEERKAKGSITYVLKGARNPLRNNFNPLVTEHFNTPVRRARLVPAGRDLHFVIELRQDVGASHQFVTSKEGHAVLQVNFGGGTFLKEPTQPIPTPAQPEDEDRGTETGTPIGPTTEPPGKRPASKGPQP